MTDTPATTLTCNECRWEMGWLHRPGEHWCAVKGSLVGNGKIAPAWCPTDRAKPRERANAE